LKDCDAHDTIAAEIATLIAQRAALRYYFADHKARLLDRLLADLEAERAGLSAQRQDLDARLADLRAREASLTVERAGHGGNRLTEIERQIEECGRTRDSRRVRHRAFCELLRRAALDPVETAEHFAVRRQQITTATSVVDTELADAQNRLTDAQVGKQRLDAEAAEVNAELRSLSPGTADDQYSEQKFLQVKRIIERFRGREGQSEADQKWTRLVTDVRNWYTFTASERYREDDSEYETYADSGGKSGGQKEKLAYTILAASLACQFKLEWGAAKSRTFRFAVIDEAFGRGSDESTRFALELFGRLGLQLLIVTPLQKIHVIEPYGAAVGFVDNPTSRYSRLRTLTIEEYRRERLAHVLSTPVAAAVA